MKLCDESILLPLQLDAADISTERQFVKQRAECFAQEKSSSPTGARMESRFVLEVPPPKFRSEQISRQNLAPISGHRDNIEPSPKSGTVSLPLPNLNPDSFITLQRFEGTVLAMRDDVFLARIIDKTARQPDEEAEIPIEEVMPGDRELVKPGAVFYWVIGYERKSYGQQTRASVIRFRRLPVWSDMDIERARSAAKTFLSFLDFDEADKPA